MFSILYEAFIIGFAIFGAVELFFKIYELFTVYGDNDLDDLSVVLTAYGHNERIEYILRSLSCTVEGIKTKKGQPYIYVVDIGMDDETREIAQDLVSDRDNLILCDKDDFMNIMSRKIY